MINWLLKNLGLHAEIDELLYQKIHDNMMERVQDKVAEIRAQAVTALQRLQVRIHSSIAQSKLFPFFIKVPRSGCEPGIFLIFVYFSHKQRLRPLGYCATLKHKVNFQRSCPTSYICKIPCISTRWVRELCSRKNLGSDRIRTWGRWVRAANATSVLDWSNLRTI